MGAACASRRRRGLAFFALFVSVVQLFLALTVHDRPAEDYRKYADTRFIGAVEDWVENGYFARGGFWIPEGRWRPADAEDDEVFAYRSYPTGYLLPVFAVQKAVHLVRGRTSIRLWRGYSLLVGWATAVLLGHLAMRLALRGGAEPARALAMGMAGAAVYATFPPTLYLVFALWGMHCAHLAIVAFLVLEEIRLDRDRPSRRLGVARFLVVLSLFAVDHVYGVFFVFAYVLLHVLVATDRHAWDGFAKTLLLPAALGLSMFLAQRLYARFFLPDLQLVGSGLMLRTGFDGSMEHYRGHLDILLNRGEGHGRLRALSGWWSLMAAGAAALAGTLVLAVKRADLRPAAILVLLPLAIYTTKAFFFSQLTAVHPYAYDQLALVAVVLSLFALVPGWLERRTRGSGIVALVVLLAGFCFAMAQIRTFAELFPLVSESWR